LELLQFLEPKWELWLKYTKGRKIVLASHVFPIVICELELVECESLETLFFSSWIVPCSKKIDHVVSCIFLCMFVCLFQIVIHVSYDITLLQIVCHSHSIIVDMSLSWKDLTYAILSLSKWESPDLVAKCRGVLWSKSRKRVSTGHTTWFWELYV